MPTEITKGPAVHVRRSPSSFDFLRRRVHRLPACSHLNLYSHSHSHLLQHLPPTEFSHGNIPVHSLSLSLSLMPMPMTMTMIQLVAVAAAIETLVSKEWKESRIPCRRKQQTRRRKNFVHLHGFGVGFDFVVDDFYRETSFCGSHAMQCKQTNNQQSRRKKEMNESSMDSLVAVAVAVAVAIVGTLEALA